MAKSVASKKSKQEKPHWTTLAVFTSSLLLIVTLLAANFTVKTTNRAGERDEWYIGRPCADIKGNDCGFAGSGERLVCKRAGKKACGTGVGTCCMLDRNLCESCPGGNNSECQNGLVCSPKYTSRGTEYRCRCPYYEDRGRIIAHPGCKDVKNGIYPSPTEYLFPGEQPSDDKQCWKVEPPPPGGLYP